jgi:hypothetical protein
LPTGLQRLDNHRLHNEQNVLLAGVVRSELGTLAGVQAALKEGSEDGRLHVGPVQRGGGAERAHIGGGQLENGIVAKKSPVEMVNLMRAKDVSRGCHGCKELAQHTGEDCGLGAIAVNHLPEEMVRQKADAVGKEAEEQPHEEMGYVLGFCAALLKTRGQLGKLSCRRFRDAS